MEERPESVEITAVSDGNPWGGETTNLESGGTILSGRVSSLEASNGGALGIVSQQKQGNGSNVGWFFVGLILAPAAMWISSIILMEIAEGLSDTGEDLFMLASFLVWPVGLIAGIVWSFTRGNKYFAIGMLTTVIGVPAVLFLAFIAMVLMWSGGI
ncbi:MAG: hypothetical protein VX959_01665 [Candidatus Thermoplasmatota archaeon]|nr:hypothetical protein [Candidatus Thermoplasmatota archaeon]MEC7458304.1 hypothetical protein [Candidatus Thermoplasmatota archaeon]